ncbi:MAG: tyrosine-type recombinase/integrase [Planctomycetota bacterium]
MDIPSVKPWNQRPGAWRVYFGGERRVYRGTREEAQRQCDLDFCAWVAGGHQRADSAVLVRDIEKPVMDWAQSHYRVTPDSYNNSEARSLAIALEKLNTIVRIQLPGQQPKTVALWTMKAEEFTRIHLRALQDDLVRQSLSASYINATMRRIVTAFEQAYLLGLIPESIPDGLRKLRRIQKRDPRLAPKASVTSLPDMHVQQIVSSLRSPIVDIVKLLRVTGMRVGEVLQMRTSSIDTSDSDVWVYNLGTNHKTSEGYQHKVIYLGPQAQEILKLPLAQATDFVWASDKNPTGHVMPHTIRRAVQSACKRLGLPAYTTHQLRHTAITAAYREAMADSLAKAKAVGGHRSDSGVLAYIDRGSAAYEFATKYG